MLGKTNAIIIFKCKHVVVDGYCSICGEYVPGLYADGAMTASWDELLDMGAINIDNGTLYTNYGMSTDAPPSSGEEDDGPGGLIGSGNASAEILWGNLVIPDTVSAIGNDGFHGCTGLTGITIPDSVNTINANAFDGCTGLTSITIPDSVRYIYGYAFYDCAGLKSIIIPNSVTILETAAFAGCRQLTSVTLSTGLTSITMRLFYNCDSLTEVVIPSTVKYIETYAFCNCTSLNLNVPSTVTSIGQNAFLNVPNVNYTGSASGSPWGAKKINGV